MYKFSRVFQQDAGQADIYEGTTAALVRAATAAHIQTEAMAVAAATAVACSSYRQAGRQVHLRACRQTRNQAGQNAQAGMAYAGWGVQWYSWYTPCWGTEHHNEPLSAGANMLC